MQRRQVLPALAERELARCCEEGRTAHQTRLRLETVGVAAAERSVGRWMAKYRRKQEEARETEAAANWRLRECEAIGRGLGSVQIGAAGAAEILESAAPDFRQKQAVALQGLFQQYLKRPTPDLLCGLLVGLHAFLLSESLMDSLRGNDA